ncbi:glycoside hydrolase family 45 protein [Sporormia fimetaria CBS 119925]|uniref:cellulase n=1 Tax=Sporormia fimetaria CBS 119925 TaxID=1340428 RepID=A0A6A6VHV3_9PLEO|nr:glycoside hydrolase family 45 protein [Sporormia fimetaria CBS 119925]
MTSTTFLTLALAALSVNAIKFDVSGEGIGALYWDCCKPSCAWNNKADFNQPVQACAKDGKSPMDMGAGTGCNGGTAFGCTDQQPWAVNDTFSYGFAGAHLQLELTQGALEDAWCCACYQLDFTSDPLKGKSMIIQASNTNYDVMDKNWFTLAVPGGNYSDAAGCHVQYGVEQTIFGGNNVGIEEKGKCDDMPEGLKPGCEWRFDWFQDAKYPTANFKRVTCPTELTDKTKCIRKDDVPAAQSEGKDGESKPGAASGLTATLSTVLGGAGLLGLALSV